MSPHVRELVDLIIRWVHFIAGIMWAGNSMLFNWLDRNLEREPGAPEGHEGRIWMVHSGGFYDVVKRQLAPSEMPERLHWFMWQNLTTWVSGICLLIVVYYFGGASLLTDPNISSVSTAGAIGVGVGSIVVSWFVYDAIYRSPLAKKPLLASIISGAGLVGVAYGLTHVLSGRAAYIHVGVILGTLMTGNVWFFIIPSQRQLVALTRAGLPQNMALNKRAKERSIHNNYMTFPLLFIMISSHFPSTYGQKLNWLVLVVLGVTSAAIRHWMNIRFWSPRWFPAAFVTFLVGVTAVYVLTAPKSSNASKGSGEVSFDEVQAIVNDRCVSCHSAHPSDEVWTMAPLGIMFDSPAQIAAAAERMRERAYVLKTMPLGNKTHMSEEERSKLAAWAEHGAKQ